MLKLQSVQEKLNTRRGRVFLENLTAYAFIFPAGAIIFIFGIFPVAFAFFVSLNKWRRFPEQYRRLQNYYDALGSLGYILFFWLAVGILIYAGWMLYQLRQTTDRNRRTWALALPGAINGVWVALFVTWFFRLLPVVLEVPRRMPRTETHNRRMFIDEFLKSFTFPEVSHIVNPMLLVLIAGVLVSFVVFRILSVPNAINSLVRFTFIFSLILGGLWLLRLTVGEIQDTIQSALENGEDLPIWSYTILLSVGVGMLGLAFLVWRRAIQQHEDRRLVFMALAAMLLMIGGYLFIVQLPQAATSADKDLLQGFWVTVLYVISTVPVQLSLGLGLAYLLFNASIGRAAFRMVYFLPYITPFAATSLVFAQLFSGRSGSPANRLLSMFGIAAQRWIVEPTPVNELILGRDLPRLLEGPGLALVVITIWASWIYIGYDAVIFMAGLGTISQEYYEAARIDGASGWAVFRYITLPLLSPTTFFLSLMAVIGTFQAFTQIWMMRRVGAYSAVDTVGIYLFETVSRDTNYGYGSAMAIVLFGVILVITLFQNRLLGQKVFYG